MLKENSKKVLDYVKANEDANITLDDIVEATGLTKNQVNGIIVSAFQKKGYMVRDEVALEVEETNDEGETVTKTKTVKYIRMTDEGRAKDFDADEQ